MVPSLALKLALPLRMALGCPEIPIADFVVASACMFARIVESGIASMRPAPKRGVGIRKMTFEFPPWPLSGFPGGPKSGWAILHPGASVRPVMTKRACTFPSFVPLGFFLNRTSRTGPLAVINQGTMFFAPLSVAIAIKGFWAGLVPPGAGCAWQERHWTELKRGPSPLFLPPETTSTSANRFDPSWKNALSSEVRFVSGPPLPGVPPRTPGSTAPFTIPSDVRQPGIARAAARQLTRIPIAVFSRTFMTTSSDVSLHHSESALPAEGGATESIRIPYERAAWRKSYPAPPSVGESSFLRIWFNKL